MTKEKVLTSNKVPGTFKVTVTAYRCRCGHEWLARGMLNTKKERPAACPVCRSPRWDKPFKYQKAEAKRRTG